MRPIHFWCAITKRNCTMQHQRIYPAVNTQAGQPTQDYYGRAIFATLCCFWPLGILALMRASEARSAVARGDFDTAEIKTSSAKTLVNLSIVAGICSYVVLSVILYVYFRIILKNSYGYD